MSAPLDILANHGAMLLAGVTALLAAGALGIRLQGAPIHRQRLGELTLAAVMIWTALALVPLPRWTLPDRTPRITSSAPVVHLPLETSGPGKLEDRRPSSDIDDASIIRALLTHERPLIRPPVSVPQPVPQPSRHISPRQVLATLYALGATSAAGWLLLGRFLLWRLVRRSAPPGPRLRELFEELRGRAGVRHVRLLIARRSLRPMSFGMMRPVVLLGPRDSLLADVDAPVLRHVLLHELAHVRQRDAWGNALLNLALPLLFFHPLYWFIRARISLAREMLADDWAAARSSRERYAADLLALAAVYMSARGAPAAVVPIFHSPSAFYRRMHMLITHKAPLAGRCSLPWKVLSTASCAIALALACAVWGVRPAAAQQTPRDNSDRAQELQAAQQSVQATAESAAADDRQQQLQRAHEQLLLELKETQDKLHALEQQIARMKSGSGTSQEPIDAAVREKLQKADLGLAPDNLSSEALRQLYLDKTGQNPSPEDMRHLRDLLGARASQPQTAEMIEQMRRAMKGDANQPAGPQASRGQLDLVALANSYADATGSVRIAQASLEAAGSDEHAVARAKAALVNAEHKARLLRSIVEVALEEAHENLNYAAKRAEVGAAPAESVSEFKARVRVLELILQAGSDSGVAPHPAAP